MTRTQDYSLVKDPQIMKHSLNLEVVQVINEMTFEVQDDCCEKETYYIRCIRHAYTVYFTR